MVNPNTSNQKTDQKQTGRIQKTPPEKTADRSEQQAERKVDSGGHNPSNISGQGIGQAPSSEQHVPGQTSQPRNTKQFQASETNFGEHQQSQSLEVPQDEDDLSRPALQK